MVVAKVSGVLASGGISVYELSARYSELGGRVQEQLAAQFEQYGLSVAQLVIENVSLPPEVEATIDQKTRMSMLSGDMDQYTRLQSADAIRDAARNPGGAAAAVVGDGDWRDSGSGDQTSRSGAERRRIRATSVAGRRLVFRRERRAKGSGR